MRISLTSANHANGSGNNKLAGVIYIIVGLFLTPWLIGFPLMLYGFCKLFE